jgi:magnesium transporter
MPNEQIAQALQDLDSDDAVYILEDLDQEDQEEILAKLPFTERIRLKRALDYPERAAGRRMQTEFVAVPPFWTVGQTIDYMREDMICPKGSARSSSSTRPSSCLARSISTRSCAPSARSRSRTSCTRRNHAIPADDGPGRGGALFEQYDLLSAAVVDENERLVGVLTIDDVVDVIQEEAEEDLMRLGGVGDEELSDTVLATSRSRVPWLLVNLHGVSGGVRDRPVRSDDRADRGARGADADRRRHGRQCRLADHDGHRARARDPDLDIYNAGRIIRRELGVGFLNGAIFAVLIGLVAGLWFQDPNLGGIIAAAMVINMMAAALAGILIPLVLDRFGVDPAVASSVFVTTVTDVVGFFAFLGLATWWFGFR